VHGRLDHYQYPGAATGCEACHGPGEAHADSGDPEDINRFLVDEGGRTADACLECHKVGTLMNWDYGQHASTDVSCVDCHRIHGEEKRRALLAKDEPDLCFLCHEDQKARFYLPSRHPLKEGYMACTQCHQVHDDRFAYIQEGERSRELCLTCHAEYHGPFIFEHSPVEESCAICHDVHGTVANNLLVQNEPFLCLQCHQPHFHSGLEAMEGTYSPISDPPGDDTDGPVIDYPPFGDIAPHTSTADAFKRVMLTKCSQCHQAIHGSDLPSQSIPGQGRALNR
jgi:DmsE family decaheme c-type cytochrome